MNLARLLLAAVLTAAALFMPLHPAQAAPGVPGSPDFGYGARLELDGPFFQDALDLASDLSLDWLALTVSWSDLAAQPRGPAALRLDQAMQYAARLGLPVLACISQPPSQALTPAGPDPAQAAVFVAGLVSQYSAIQTVELFPAANTAAGWSAAPNPTAYVTLYRAVRAALDAAGSPVLLVAAGLKPIQSTQSPQDMDDLVFLQALYTAGLAAPVVSLTLDDLTSDPLASPGAGERRILRHYEEVRAVMLNNQHRSGLIWITSIASPSGTIDRSDPYQLDPQSQVSWLLQAYAQLRSQLYVGVAVYSSLNPPAAKASNRALIMNAQEYHPFTSLFRDLLSQNSAGPLSPQNGRPKDKALEKRRT